jgi:aminoglycoside phosphotransferase (APT) family kinase protein
VSTARRHGPADVDIERLGAAVAEVLTPILGDKVSVGNLLLLTGGAGRTTWAFDAFTQSGSQALILRTGTSEDGRASMELEATVQTLAAAAGVPVPVVVVADDSVGILETPYLICSAVKGETIPRRIQRGLDDGGRQRLLVQCADALAAIHRTDISTGIELAQEDQLARWRTALDVMGDTTATFEYAFRWLEAHRPEPSPIRLVHGDFRMGNLIVDNSTLAAVLDWELVHAGEIYEDLGWFCTRAWRFGAPEQLGAAGLGSVARFLSHYERSAGITLDRHTFRWWLTLTTLSWGVMSRMQAERHLSGQTRSVELAAIGRRVCETEWDLLELFDGAGPR